MTEIRGGAIHTGVTAFGAGAVAVPGTFVAVGMRDCTDASHMFHHAAEIGGFDGAGLVFVIFVSGTAVMHQFIGVETGAVVRIKVFGFQFLETD